ncbi:MAG: tetratricopeptide repeat protein [Nodosilinea sp.]
MDIYQQLSKTVASAPKPSARPIAKPETKPLAVFQNPATARAAGDASDQALSQSAMQAVQLKQYGWALSLLDQLIARHPHRAVYYSNRSLVKLWSGDQDAALEDCNQAIKLSPDLDQAFNNRATCYAAVGLMEQAIQDYERAIDLNPFNVRARINLGATLRDLGNLDEALARLDEALLFYQLPEFIYAERGRTYHLRGDWNCAIADYRRALAAAADSELTHPAQQMIQRVKGWMAELVPST